MKSSRLKGWAILQIEFCFNGQRSKSHPVLFQIFIQATFFFRNFIHFLGNPKPFQFRSGATPTRVQKKTSKMEAYRNIYMVKRSMNLFLLYNKTMYEFTERRDMMV